MTCPSSAELHIIKDIVTIVETWPMTKGGIVFAITNQTGVGKNRVFPGNLLKPSIQCTDGRLSEYHLITAFVACDPVDGVLCKEDKEVCALDTRTNPGIQCRPKEPRSCNFELAGTKEFFLCHKDNDKFTLKTECEALNSGTWSGVEVMGTSNRKKVHPNSCKDYDDFWETTADLDTLVLRQGIPVGTEAFTLKPREGKASTEILIQCSLVHPVRDKPSSIQLKGNRTEGWTVEAGDLQGKRMKLLCYATNNGIQVARWQFYLYPARVVVKGDDGNFTCNWPNWTRFKSEKFVNSSCPKKLFLLKFPPEKHAENNITFETHGIPTTTAPTTSAPTTLETSTNQLSTHESRTTETPALTTNGTSVIEKRTTTDKDGLDTYILVAIIGSSVAGGIGLLVAIYIGYRVKKSMDRKRRELAPPRLGSPPPPYTEEQKAIAMNKERMLEAYKKKYGPNADAKEPWTPRLRSHGPTEEQKAQERKDRVILKALRKKILLDERAKEPWTQSTQSESESEPTSTNTEDGNPDAEEPRTQRTMTESEQAQVPGASTNTEVDGNGNPDSEEPTQTIMT
ncbi:MAG: hypothetical protein GY696_26995, partial [Gammaproteobacteria bacterium]|nr:hypothetical protein [Gammaproteobacteria bacterium]